MMFLATAHLATSGVKIWVRQRPDRALAVQDRWEVLDFWPLLPGAPPAANDELEGWNS